MCPPELMPTLPAVSACLLACCAAGAALVPHRPAFFLDHALPFLLPLCTDGVLEARHGAVAALAEILPALRCGGCGWSWVERLGGMVHGVHSPLDLH